MVILKVDVRSDYENNLREFFHVTYYFRVRSLRIREELLCFHEADLCFVYSTVFITLDFVCTLTSMC